MIERLRPEFRAELVKRTESNIFLSVGRFADGNIETLKTWDEAANVVFGAVLSAFAGIQLTSVEPTTQNGLLLAGICFLHTFFLWSILFLRNANWMPARVPSFGYIAYITIAAILALLLAGFLWSRLFGDTLLYAFLVTAWFVVWAMSYLTMVVLILRYRRWVIREVFRIQNEKRKGQAKA